MMQSDSYLTTLLAGLPVGGANGRPLASVLAQAWQGAQAKVWFGAGRLPHQPASDPDRTFLPVPEAPTLLDEAASYQQEWAQLERLTAGQDRAQRYSAFFLSQAYGARAAAKDGPDDAAVFDQNRLEAAKLSCRAYSGFAGKYLFVKGAVSGIQSFIYQNIQAEQVGEAQKVSKRLRGRSFFVTILGDIVAEYLVEALGLEQANVLFVGGGHFNLLLPDTPELRTELAKLKRRLNVKLFEQFRLNLGIFYGEHSFDENGFDQMANVIQEATDNLESNKQRRYHEVLEESIFHVDTVIPGKRPDEEEDDFEDMGTALPHAEYLIEIRGTEEQRMQLRSSGRKNDLVLNLKATEADYYLAESLSGWQNAWGGLHQHSGVFVKIIRLNHTEFLPTSTQWAGLPIGYGFRFVGQATPKYDEDGSEESGKKKGGLMFFEDIAVPADKNIGYAQLAAMRLDVDDLGALFRYGLKGKSFACMLSLSREMQYFFAGYLNALADKRHIYVVYSGGDDAFVIGSWYDMLHFARDLRAAFARLAANNPEVGFSAGIYTCHPKYPVARLADDAAEQEDKAKQREGGGKNAICAFDHTLDWARYDDMLNFSADLALHVGSSEKGSPGAIRRSLLQHLLLVIRTAFEAEEREKAAGIELAPGQKHFEFYRNLGRLHALLSRRGYIGRSDDPHSAPSIVGRMLRDMTDFNQFADYLLPLNVVLYQTRS